VKTIINLVRVYPHLTHKALSMNGCFCDPMNWLVEALVVLLVVRYLLQIITFFWYGFICCLISIHCEQGSSIFLFEKIISSFDVCDFVSLDSVEESPHDDHINHIDQESICKWILSGHFDHEIPPFFFIISFFFILCPSYLIVLQQ
jgi:hypothetical protein